MPRSLNHSLNRRLNRYSTTLLGGARRPRSAGVFAAVFRAFRDYFKVRTRLARTDPHLCGPEAPAYFCETLAAHRRAVVVDAALERVYAPPAPGEIRSSEQVWSQAYPVFDSESEKRKWVKNWSRFRKQK